MSTSAFTTSAKQKVTFCIPSFRFGGGERVIVDLANVLAGRGFSVDLIVISPSGEYKSQVNPKVRVVSFGTRRMTLCLLPFAAYLRRGRPVALMALSEHTHLLAVAATMFSRVDTRIILRIGTMLSLIQKTRRALRDRIIAPLSRALYPKADLIIANSEGVAHDVVVHYGIDRKNITVIHNPKNIEEITHAAAVDVSHPWLGEGKTIPVIVAVGRFRVQKGFTDLITAFALLQEKVESRLLIVGEGREQPSLEALVAKLGVAERVSFTGYVANPHCYVARADVFAMTSLWEGLPNALLEALICGKPVVATDCDSGPREILAPETDPLKRIRSGIEWTKYGALVPVGGHTEIAEALAVLLSDANLQRECSQEARKRGNDFDARDIIEEYIRAMGLPETDKTQK